MRARTWFIGLAVLTAAACVRAPEAAEVRELLNVSYDLSQYYYKDYNQDFRARHPQVVLGQSHGGSSKQALAVANGLKADVVTMNEGSDIEFLVQKGLVRPGWQNRFPYQAVPFSSVTVLLVRQGNPKHIRDWADLSREGVQAVFANPKTSGNGRYAVLAAYGGFLDNHHGDQAAAQADLGRMLRQVPVWETGSRSATVSFVVRGLGDVLITPENEARLAAQVFGHNQFEVVYPSKSLRLDNPVAVVDKVVEAKHSRALAQEYLLGLFTPQAQEWAAQRFYRPSDPQILARHRQEFPALETYRVEERFGSWQNVKKIFFNDGGLVDRLLAQRS